MTKVNSIYLAYPIDQAIDFADDFYALVEKVKRDAARTVSWVFDPGDAFTVNPRAETDPGVAAINRQALAAADAIVAFLPRGVPSIGVPMEIARAHDMGKAMLVVSDAVSYMLELNATGRVTEFSGEALADGLDWLLMQEMEDDLPAGIKFTGDAAFTPAQSYSDDAGFDLVISERTYIPGNTFVDVPCGISVEMPERVWGMITGRSSTLRKKGLLVHPGVIDTGYRGPLFAACYNMGDDPVIVSKGERVAQLILFNNTSMRYKPMLVDSLAPSPRGTNGFGSSGA